MSLRARLFLTYTLVVLVSLAVTTLAVTLLMRKYVDTQSQSRLDNMARPIYVQIVGLIRGNVTPQQLLTNLQEQADRNRAYILLTDASGDIVRQLVPLQAESPPHIGVSSGTLPQGITSETTGRFTASDGRTFIFSAYPLIRQTGQLSRVEMLVLAIPRPGTFSVILTFIWPLLIAAGIALIVSLAIAVWLSRSVFRPLATMTQAARQISQGDYTQKIEVTGPAEIKELADSFNRMTEDVERAQLQLRHFVADVSHELRSPLTSIQGFSQALIDGTATDDNTKLQAAQIIGEEARRLKRQVDELLQLSRMQSNPSDMRREPVELKELLEHCVEVFSVQANQRQIKIELKTDPEIVVLGDFERLEQVFNNLLDNAIKNSAAGGRIRINSVRSEGAFAWTTVQDDGPGIPSDQLPHVFERFYQVTGVRTGVGLGLAIAREIVTAHHGSIEVSSSPGEGARFTVILPVIKAHTTSN